MTAYTFTLAGDVPIPVGAQMLIRYPNQITVNSVFTGCQLSNKYPETQCIFGDGTNTVTITEVTNVVIAPGTMFQVTLYGLINSQFAAATDSFTFEVRTRKGNAVMQ
jgi:hypothetical protein